MVKETNQLKQESRWIVGKALKDLNRGKILSKEDLTRAITSAEILILEDDYENIDENRLKKEFLKSKKR